jgi:hypothetical protein
MIQIIALEHYRFIRKILFSYLCIHKTPTTISMNLLYINWDINPEIANILGIPLKYYGLLFLTGLVLCLNILKHIYKKENLSSKAHDALFSYALIGILWEPD